MTKNRYTAPFGYTFKKGLLVPHPAENRIVRQIFADYIAGASLQGIADNLAGRKVEYLPGQSAWNKGRVKRVLEDSRYLGDVQFPALVDTVTFSAVQSRKQERNHRKAIQPEGHISQLAVPVACAACGATMSRQHHAKLRVPDAWSCPCGVNIRLADADLLAGITEILKRLVNNPDLVIEEPNQPDETLQLEVRRLQNEINWQMEGFDFDREAVQRDIFSLAAAKFKALPSGPTTTYLLRAAFEKSAPLDSFPRGLLEATVTQVLLGSGGVGVKLKNGQIIGKDDGHGSDTAENRAGDPGEA